MLEALTLESRLLFETVCFLPSPAKAGLRRLFGIFSCLNENGEQGDALNGYRRK